MSKLKVCYIDVLQTPWLAEAYLDSQQGPPKIVKIILGHKAEYSEDLDIPWLAEAYQIDR